MGRLTSEASGPPPAFAALAASHSTDVVWKRVLLIFCLSVGIVATIGGTGPGYRLIASRSNQLQGGIILQNRTSAPDFTLSDQSGSATTLSSLRGRPVVLTFVYTRCVDVCPLIAANLHQVYRSLGTEAQQIEILAVTVDPEGDTPENIRQFLDQRGLTEEWRFLTGARDELAVVWSTYHIDAQPGTLVARPISPLAQWQARELPAPPDVVEHSAPIFLIDKRGALRVALPLDATPDILTTDLRILLGES
jgi:protein SCO1/2